MIDRPIVTGVRHGSAVGQCATEIGGEVAGRRSPAKCTMNARFWWSQIGVSVRSYFKFSTLGSRPLTAVESGGDQGTYASGFLAALER